MPIKEFDLLILHRTITDATRRVAEVQERLAADQGQVSGQLAASQEAIERSLKILSAARDK